MILDKLDAMLGKIKEFQWYYRFPSYLFYFALLIFIHPISWIAVIVSLCMGEMHTYYNQVVPALFYLGIFFGVVAFFIHTFIPITYTYAENSVPKEAEIYIQNKVHKTRQIIIEEENHFMFLDISE